MANYTSDQETKIMQMPSAVLLDAMLAESGNMVVSMREFMAGEKFISEARTAYPKNTLIQNMTKNVNLPKMEESIKHVFSIGDDKAMQVECEKKIQDGINVLGNDPEAKEFKSFLLNLAEKVVQATGEGFFGTKGNKISPDETAFISNLKQKLQV